MTLPRLFLSLFLGAAPALAQVPVTDAPAASANDIRFVVMPDRTGGMRAGVFRDALRKANLLHPEFMISVGDLIDGYTLDPRLLESQWREFDAMVTELDMPFYYVAGNHDISNAWMEEQWRERLGDPYYHFEYKGALFLALHTEDGGKSGISREQGEYFARILAEHPDVRWTFLFMHRPLWSYGNQQGFERIGEALQGRRYTLMSGHHHNYYYEPDAHENERLILGTAGGGSNLRGAEFGEFDHVTHVVLTENGPKITHLKLDGFVDKAIVSPANRPQVEALRSGGFASVTPSVADGPLVTSLSGVALLENPANTELRVRLQFPEGERFRFEADVAELSLKPKQSRELAFRLLPKGSERVDLSQLPQLFIEAVGVYAAGTDEELSLPAKKLWRVDWKRALPEEAGLKILLDGKLGDWKDASWVALDPPGYFEEGWDWRGKQDCELRFALRRDGSTLYVAVEVQDDRHLFGEGELRDSLTLYFDAGSSVKEFEYNPTESGLLATDDAVVSRTGMTIAGQTLRLEIALPLEALGVDDGSEALRFNLRYLDHDNEQNQKPSRLYWKPKWGSSEDYDGSGRFEL